MALKRVLAGVVALGAALVACGNASDSGAALDAGRISCTGQAYVPNLSVTCGLQTPECGDCIRIRCQAETDACSADPAGPAANARLYGCGCLFEALHDWSSLTSELAAFSATGPAEASAGRCLAERCASLCGLP